MNDLRQVILFMAICWTGQDLLHDDYDVVHFYGLHGTKVAERQKTNVNTNDHEKNPTTL